MKKLVLLNTSIVTSEGEFILKTITLAEARELISRFHPEEVVSAIGHDATAQIMSTLLGRNIPVNRIQFSQKAGQAALVFKLNGRALEGKIFTIDELEEIGYTWQVLVKLSDFDPVSIMEFLEWEGIIEYE